MCVGLRACNAAVLSDCDRYPLWIESAKRCIKYWMKILMMSDTRYVKKCYIMQKLLDDYGQINWVTKIRQLLFTNGFGYIWLNQNVHNASAFITELVQRLQDQSIQSWNSDIANSSKICLYRNYKLNYEHGAYLTCLNIRKFRHAMSKFRSGYHNLEIELGRHDGGVREIKGYVVYAISV